MKELFRCLEAPLLSLKITLCWLPPSDLESLAQRWNYSQLKHLCLRGAALTHLNVMPVNVFSESVVDTLQTLELEDCRKNDFHLSIFLLSLTQCPQLSSINLYDNGISMDVLKDFLHHTTSLSQLTMEMCPAPVEGYELGYVEVGRLSQLCAELMNTLTAVRQLKSVCFGSYPCYDCGTRYIYEKEVRLCECQE